ncbi:iron ABC transporter permease [Vibrio sp. qd031]|uniref:ABC transporter permease n=1 Tax=Vibrio sp. qd031 TaxID=1603038 RepID=UPI000A118710|nr:iron ABC transporter permease [Vibrio sp. qd031]ORT48888.1 iron ABC transporter permease [Vibrio sp. qd031]
MKQRVSRWKWSSVGIAGILALPILAVFYLALGDDGDIFSHLLSTVMPTYIYNTFALVIGVMLLSALLGVPTAWLMAMCRLPGDKYLQWMLVLPLAIPGYIVGYLFTEWFDFAGPIQRLLRDIMGWQAGDYWFPDIRTLGGAVWVLSLVLYPYVYLLARAAFMEQNMSLLQSARLLKCSPKQSFLRVSLPLARPAIAVGLSLVAMEAVGDFGLVNYFAVNTLTTAVYDTWLGYSSLTAAAKISSIMLLVIILFISAERFSRRKQKQYQNQFSSQEEKLYHPTGWKKWLALIWCWGLLLTAFILPMLQLGSFALVYWEQSWTPQFRQFALNSFTISSISAVIAVAIAVLVNFYHRLQPSVSSKSSLRIASLGYAVPGTVLAIGVIAPIMTLDHWVNDVAKYFEWGRPGLIFSGSMFALIFAMVVRFAAVAIGSVESNLQKVSPSLDLAARTMGCNSNQMLKRVHIPLIKRGALIAGLLVFIESMKELNASLLLRPFNFETLATYVYNFASDEQLEVAALPAMLLVVVGLIPLILVNRSLEQTH